MARATHLGVYQKKVKLFGFHAVVGTRENLSIDVITIIQLATNVRLILTKLNSSSSAQFKIQVKILNVFEKEIKFFGFHGVAHS